MERKDAMIGEIRLFIDHEYQKLNIIPSDLNFKCIREYKKYCNNIYSVGARDTKKLQIMTFCSVNCLCDYFQQPKIGTWNKWVASSNISDDNNEVEEEEDQTQQN